MSRSDFRTSWAREHLELPLTVEDLARQAMMSSRTRSRPTATIAELCHSPASLKLPPSTALFRAAFPR
jgi:hypothetical protein